MLHHSIGDVGDGHLGSWGFQQGGMGGVSDSIRRSAESFGAEIRTDARVKKILVRGGRAVGVALENGEELRAPVVVSSIHPKIAFLDLIDRHELPADFVWDIERWKTRSRRREGERGALRAAGLHRGPRQEPAGPPHRLGRALLQPAVRGARVPGRAHRAQGRGARRSSTARSRPRSTRSSRPRACTCSRCSASGCPTTGTRSRTATSSSSTRTGSSTSTRSSRRTSRPR